MQTQRCMPLSTAAVACTEHGHHQATLQAGHAPKGPQTHQIHHHAASSMPAQSLLQPATPSHIHAPCEDAAPANFSLTQLTAS